MISTIESSSANQRPTRVRFVVVGLVILLGMVTYLDRACIGTLEDPIMRDLELSQHELSYAQRVLLSGDIIHVLSSGHPALCLPSVLSSGHRQRCRPPPPHTDARPTKHASQVEARLLTVACRRREKPRLRSQ